MEETAQQPIITQLREETKNESTRVRFPSSERMAQTLSEREESRSDTDLSIQALELQLLKEEEMSDSEPFEVSSIFTYSIKTC